MVSALLLIISRTNEKGLIDHHFGIFIVERSLFTLSLLLFVLMNKLRTELHWAPFNWIPLGPRPTDYINPLISLTDSTVLRTNWPWISWLD
jgi:hypothetical protein